MKNNGHFLKVNELVMWILNSYQTRNDFKTEQAKNTLEFSQMDGVKKLADASGTVADAISWAGEKFPGLTTAVVTATTAIKAMTAAAVTFAGLKLITG
ncbi:hypothetical protein QT341_26210 [Escherichia coli]|nr:hypothetical protein [Escherichia coli]